MAKYLIRISDYNDNAFSLLITVPAWGKPSWRTTDKGWIRYNSGPAVVVDQSKYNPFTGSPGDDWTRHKHLYLSNGANTGLLLYDFMGWTSANDSGRGYLYEVWALNADGGPLGWTVSG